MPTAAQAIDPAIAVTDADREQSVGNTTHDLGSSFPGFQYGRIRAPSVLYRW
jgi:hypothetical protein